jgi:hypothetical protein
MAMDDEFEYLLIRDATVLLRVPCRHRDPEATAQFFDVRTGVQLKQIYPGLQQLELDRGYPISREIAGLILKSGAPASVDAGADPSKVVTILEVKQRRLDAVVADSILDQLRVISDLLVEILKVADNAHREERFWLSQQLLTLVRKFTGRELSELEEMVEWFRRRPHK